jgi:3-oxoacyl-[acyl-carrier protein] reductase
MKKTALITGASRGIGRAIASTLARSNYEVIIHYNTSKKEALEFIQILKQNQCSYLALKADLTNPEEASQMVTDATSHFGKIDLLVNNAGISQYKLFTHTTEQDWENILNANLKSTFRCTKLVLPQMLKRKSGNIINISSVWGITGASLETIYSASKAAVIGFTKALAKEVAPSNINVNCIAPGIIHTNMLKNLEKNELEALKGEVPLGRLGEPNDIAQTVLFLASDNAGYITGQVISPNGGFVI